jgi:hypothetical protein
VFTTDEVLTAEIEVAHFGPVPLKDAAPAFKLVGDDGKAVFEGRLSPKDVPLDNGVAFGPLNLDLRRLPAPARYKLVVGLDGAGAAPTPSSTTGEPQWPIRRFENDWDLWVYPPRVDTQAPAGVMLVDDLNEPALAALDTGAKVLLMIPPDRVAADRKLGKIALGFSSIFWNTAWTGRQPPHTMGILCDPTHPAFADFPTDDHSNWQWWYLVSRAGAMILDDLPPALRPTVQVIDDWFTARKLGLVFEAKCRKGKLLVCSVDLKNGLGDNPVGRQFRHSLLRYVASDRFMPQVVLTPEQVRSLMAPPAATR